MAKNCNYKVTYFDITALGEPIRFLLAYGNFPFEDHRVKFDDWPALKPSMPFGQLPTFEINGETFHQSMAIVRYLAKKVHLYGKSDEQALKIDMMADTVNDLRQHIGKYFYHSDEKFKAQLRKTLYEETMPYYLKKFDKYVKDNNGYFVDGQLTYVDLYFVSLLDYIKYMLDGKSLTDGYENLQKLTAKVYQVPQIKTWLEKRPKTDR
uniref:glutathione transferase n=1 Tax=Cuerna arida TaxID=1464854 RepID=A0A1B6F138_9HEMI